MTMKKSRWTKGGLATTTALMTMAAAEAAHADERFYVLGAGFFLNLTFGEQWNFGPGIEIHASTVFGVGEPGELRPQSTFGAFAQATWLMYGGSGRIAAGLHAGYTTTSPHLGHDFELGWVWQGRIVDQPSGHGIHIGYQFVGLAAARLTLINGGECWIPEGHLAVGTYSFGRYGEPSIFEALGQE